MFPSIDSSKQSRCTFDSKGQFTTNLELAFTRNQSHASPQSRVPYKREFWIKQPPDFSYRLYITSGLPSEPLGKAKKELKKKAATLSPLYEELNRIRSRWILPETEKEEPPKIITRFPHVGPYEAKLKFVKTGKHSSGKYQDPKPYDFRQYERVIPDFVTSYARDPLDLKLKLQHLSTVHGLQPLTETKRESKARFITCKPHEVKWDSKLILPKEPWPARSGSFTRHRGQRGAHSAFIERVEETLSKLWQKEATQKHVQSRTKADSTRQKRQSIPLSLEEDSEVELTKSQHEKGQQKAQLLQSASTGWEMLVQTGLPIHIKAEPLGYLLPSGIAQSVEDLRCK